MYSCLFVFFVFLYSLCFIHSFFITFLMFAFSLNHIIYDRLFLWLFILFWAGFYLFCCIYFLYLLVLFGSSCYYYFGFHVYLFLRLFLSCCFVAFYTFSLLLPFLLCLCFDLYMAFCLVYCGFIFLYLLLYFRLLDFWGEAGSGGLSVVAFAATLFACFVCYFCSLIRFSLMLFFYWFWLSLVKSLMLFYVKLCFYACCLLVLFCAIFYWSMCFFLFQLKFVFHC